MSGLDERLAEAGPADFWDVLRLTTQARIGLGRAGDALPTRRVLQFRSAHAEARDAVHEPLDVDAVAAAVEAVGIGTPLRVASRAADRGEYLRRPDLGREPASLDGLPSGASGASSSGDSDGAGSSDGEGWQVGFVLADGLSPRAVAEHGAPLLAALVEELRPTFSLAPPVIATGARVALADHVAAAMGVETLLVLIGERPGLSVADSLGVYLTHAPRPGRADSERNCISNVHPPDGLDYATAARVAAGLVRGARALGASGVARKDTSRAAALAASRADPATLPGSTGA